MRSTTHFSSTKNNDKGLTLIELLVGLAVATIVMVVGVPSYKHSVSNQHSTTTVNEFVTALNLARSSAVKSSRHVTVCKSRDLQTCESSNAGWNIGWIVFVNESYADAANRSAGEELLRVYPAIDSNGSFLSSGPTENYISFRPTGDTDITGTWTYCDERGANYAKAVVVLRSGRAQTSDQTVDGSDLQCGGSSN